MLNLAVDYIFKIYLVNLIIFKNNIKNLYYQNLNFIGIGLNFTSF